MPISYWPAWSRRPTRASAVLAEGQPFDWRQVESVHQGLGRPPFQVPREVRRQIYLANELVTAPDQDPVLFLGGGDADAIDITGFLDLIQVDPVKGPYNKPQMIFHQVPGCQDVGLAFIGEQGGPAE